MTELFETTPITCLDDLGLLHQYIDVYGKKAKADKEIEARKAEINDQEKKKNQLEKLLEIIKHQIELLQQIGVALNFNDDEPDLELMSKAKKYWKTAFLPFREFERFYYSIRDFSVASFTGVDPFSDENTPAHNDMWKAVKKHWLSLLEECQMHLSTILPEDAVEINHKLIEELEKLRAEVEERLFVKPNLYGILKIGKPVVVGDASIIREQDFALTELTASYQAMITSSKDVRHSQIRRIAGGFGHYPSFVRDEREVETRESSQYFHSDHVKWLSPMAYETQFVPSVTDRATIYFHPLTDYCLGGASDIFRKLGFFHDMSGAIIIYPESIENVEIIITDKPQEICANLNEKLRASVAQKVTLTDGKIYYIFPQSLSPATENISELVAADTTAQLTIYDPETHDVKFLLLPSKSSNGIYFYKIS